ncbi:hypothetical protein Peetri_00172 [Pseudomonas phage vB_PpuM-Peetri]
MSVTLERYVSKTLAGLRVVKGETVLTLAVVPDNLNAVIATWGPKMVDLNDEQYSTHLANRMELSDLLLQGDLFHYSHMMLQNSWLPDRMSKGIVAACYKKLESALTQPQ